MADDDVTLVLSRDEALVLSDWLGRHQALPDGLVEHTGERVALWHLGALLERELVELFCPEYGGRVAAARARPAAR